MIELLFCFMFICFRCVFLDIWWMVLQNGGREPTDGFPRRGECGLLCRDVRTGHLLAPVAVLRLATSFLSRSLLYHHAFWSDVRRLWPRYKSLLAWKVPHNSFIPVISVHTQKSLHSALQPCVLPNQIQDLFLSITQLLLPLKYITVFIWFQWHPMFYASSIVHPLPGSFLWQHFDGCYNH